MLPPPNWRSVVPADIAFTDVRLLDPGSGLDRPGVLVVKGGVIESLDRLPPRWKGETFPAQGLIACPGLFDMHVHLREPGYEHKETVASGCRAAAAGGFTGVAAMPNTDPPVDNPGLVKFVRERASELPVEVVPVAAVTRGRKGAELSDFAELSQAGVTAFSDDGAPVASADLMRRALEFTRMTGAVIIQHCEDPALSDDGIMHEGAHSTRLGLAPWPAIAEETMVERDLRLAEFTGGRLHLAHLSSAGSVELLRAARRRKVHVTAEVTPHHLVLDCSVLSSFNSDFKVNPPLRDPSDIQALISALADGTIDAVATDHAPHAPDEKDVEITQAPFGMIGLETALGVIITKLVKPGLVPLHRVLEAMTDAPRSILKLPPVHLSPGYSANITLFDPDETWTVDRMQMVSKSRNTPFHGWQLTGRAVAVVNRGIAWVRVR